MSAVLPVQASARMFGFNGPGLLPWGGFVAAMLCAPLVFTSDASLSYLSQLGTVILFCLSYNMLLGQGGMLSFGHAVYSGLGAYFAIHAMNWAAHGGPPIPVILIPLVGGLSGLIFGIVFGYVMTKKSGTIFAMITLGFGELVHAIAQMFTGFFGGEGGVTTDRTYGPALFGLTFGPQRQVYYLIAAWLLLCTLAMYAFTRTPLGRMANAVRDNPERAEFVGYDTRKVRYLVLILSAFFAGISGGLAAINFEIVSAESLSAVRSGDALIYTFIGGAGSFAGPIVGAIFGTLLTIKLSDYTVAWQLYLGAFFILFVIFAPSGLMGIFEANWRLIRAGLFGRVLSSWLAVVAASLVILAGAVILVELGYALSFGAKKAALVSLLLSFGHGTLTALAAGGVGLIVAGTAWLHRASKDFGRDWGQANADIAAAEDGGGR